MSTDPSASPRPFVLHEANYRQLLDARPNLAVLPWGATEAHNYHLPHGTDIIEATELAERAAQVAHQRGAKVIVLPAIPYGNNAQQLDQVATIHLSTTTAAAILHDVVESLLRQGISRLLILNAHGGNEFKPLVRDLQARFPVLIVVVNFWQMIPHEVKRIFDEPGDHAGELESSLMLHLRPEWVMIGQAGEGKSIPFKLRSLKQPGVWTPRPWSNCQPDTGAGDPKPATAEKGAEYVGQVSRAIGQLMVELAAASASAIP
jgi:creatinine amidohydrolase